MTNKIAYTNNKLTHTCYAREIRSQAIEHGIISPDWEWLLTSVIYEHNQIKRLERLLSRIEDLMNEIWSNHYDNLEFLLQKLGIPKWMGDYIMLDNVMAPVPLRWDIIYENNMWKVIEINTGFCLGGLNGFSMNNVRNNFYRVSGSNLDVPDLDNSFYFLAKGIIDTVGKNSIIPVIETTEGYHKYDFYLHNFVSNMNKTKAGLYISGTINDFNFKEDCTYFKGHAVTHFIPMFNLYELNETQENHCHFLKKIRSGEIVSLLGFRELIFSNKAFIPYLIDYAKDSLAANEAKEIVALFPSSEVLNPSNVVLFHDGDFVLKPAEGYGGNGIVCSWMCQQEEWLKALDDALSDDNLWVIQERIIGELSYMQSVDRNGKVKEGLSSVVHGLITFNGNLIGNLTRAAIGVQQPGVINAHQGAAFGLSGINLHFAAEYLYD
ncbi:hypothetical protein [Brenneria rubrifaciens]|uniref:Glutathionylspermidine synthase pre-ATP-grasp-like domain-containing protein n=1 Tax=Brenneria rubrifaciens TaxID=55213 RepID=A0A4P8QUM4_9GAMM|nr:hypothetical protein [Brenneria rubrifaciens]QCR09200.1 hypothetical protein EH207_12085 [Brenneria rubrifaciens]